MDTEKLLSFLSKIEKCKCNTRHSFTSSGRPESVAEHSWRLTVMAYLVAPYLDGIDGEKLMKMCLVHDFGEAVTGDIPSFLKTDRNIADEDAEVVRLLAGLPEPARGGTQALFDEMKELSTPEAKAWRALDMTEAVISHNEADISSWIPSEYEMQLTYGVAESQCHPVLAALRGQVLSDTREKIAAAQKKGNR